MAGFVDFTDHSKSVSAQMTPNATWIFTYVCVCVCMYAWIFNTNKNVSHTNVVGWGNKTQSEKKYVTLILFP
jgi:hypothetical protein